MGLEIPISPPVEGANGPLRKPPIQWGSPKNIAVVLGGMSSLSLLISDSYSEQRRQPSAGAGRAVADHMGLMTPKRYLDRVPPVGLALCPGLKPGNKTKSLQALFSPVAD